MIGGPTVVCLQVRFASRRAGHFAEEEVIPVVGSYELRSLSRVATSAPSAAVSTATGACNAAGAHTTCGHITGVSSATDLSVCTPPSPATDTPTRHRVQRYRQGVQ